MAEGSQGPRTYRFSAQRVRVTKRRKPGEVVWAIWRCNLDGSEPRYYLSNAPRRTLPWRPWRTWAVPGGVLKRSSRLRRATWGWTNTRPGAGRAGITISPCACWAGHSCWTCSRNGGKDAPDHPIPSVPGGAGDAAPGTVRTEPSCCGSWRRRKTCNERPRGSHGKRRAADATRGSGRPCWSAQLAVAPP